MNNSFKENYLILQEEVCMINKAITTINIQYYNLSANIKYY
jgi:hypothetical protein